MTGSFDENNPKYWVLCKRVHIRMAARFVGIVLIVFVGVNVIMSFGKSTSIMVYSWITACFALGIYGSLMYGVFKEKRLFTLPFLVMQAILVGLLTLAFFIFIVCALFSHNSIKKIGIEVGSIDSKATESEQTKRKFNSIQLNMCFSELRGFVVMFFIMVSLLLAAQLWFLEIIYRFFHFLKDRETSFNFNLENEFQMTD
jgi:hypothetical protein